MRAWEAINNFSLGPSQSASPSALPSPISGLRNVTEITEESSDVIHQNIVGGGGRLSNILKQSKKKIPTKMERPPKEKSLDCG